MAPTASTLAPADKIRQLGLASGVLSRDDVRDLEIGCEATKKVLLSKAQALVAGAHGMPVLTSKSCDGTPLNVTHESRVRLGTTGKQVTTKGRKGS